MLLDFASHTVDLTRSLLLLAIVCVVSWVVGTAIDQGGEILRHHELRGKWTLPDLPRLPDETPIFDRD
jgi:hypothetical protein